MLVGFQPITEQVHTFNFLFDGVAERHSFDTTWGWFGVISAIVQSGKVYQQHGKLHILKMYTTHAQ